MEQMLANVKCMVLGTKILLSYSGFEIFCIKADLWEISEGIKTNFKRNCSSE